MKGNCSMFTLFLAVVILVNLTAGIVSAAPVAQNITYQGKLTNAAGTPLFGTYTFTFRLYNVSTGGTALDTIIQDVKVDKGLFTTSLTFNPAVFDGRALWLGVKAGADPEMTPRQEILPVPYALSLAGGISDQILAGVMDIQTKVNTVLTKLTTLQAGVTAINTTVNTIRARIDTPPEPIRYEYYTGKLTGYDSSSQLWILTDITNTGDSAANICVIEYGQHSQLSSWKEFKNHCYLLNPHWSKSDTPTVVTNVSYSRFVKITSDSKFVAPQARFFDSYISNTVPAFGYLPGDFQKVEIYR
jgi:outer membrane murein-binding lipoprotein Lpp